MADAKCDVQHLGSVSSVIKKEKKICNVQYVISEVKPPSNPGFPRQVFYVAITTVMIN